MMVVTIPFLGLLMFFVWPVFNVIINGFGHLLASAGAFGTFIYGFLERLLIPTGLHHILNQLSLRSEEPQRSTASRYPAH